MPPWAESALSFLSSTRLEGTELGLLLQKCHQNPARAESFSRKGKSKRVPLKLREVLPCGC